MEFWKLLKEFLLIATAQRWHIGDSQEPGVCQIDITWSSSNWSSRSVDPDVALL